MILLWDSRRKVSGGKGGGKVKITLRIINYKIDSLVNFSFKV